MITFYIEDGRKSKSHTMALRNQYQLLKWIYVIIIMNSVQQSRLINAFCLPSSYFYPSCGTVTPIPLGSSSSTPWFWRGCDRGVSLPN